MILLNQILMWKCKCQAQTRPSQFSRSASQLRAVKVWSDFPFRHETYGAFILSSLSPAPLCPYVREVVQGCNGLLADSDICLLEEDCDDASVPRVELEMHRVVSFPPADIICAVNTFSTKKMQTSKKTLPPPPPFHYNIDFILYIFWRL